MELFKNQKAILLFRYQLNKIDSVIVIATRGQFVPAIITPCNGIFVVNIKQNTMDAFFEKTTLFRKLVYLHFHKRILRVATTIPTEETDFISSIQQGKEHISVELMEKIYGLKQQSEAKKISLSQRTNRTTFEHKTI